MATITVTDLATDLGTDARTARKFLRSVTPRDEQPGKGKRWEIEKRNVRSLKSRFAKYEQELEAQRKAKAEAAEESLAEVQAEIDAEADEAMNDSQEPTDAELALIELDMLDD